MTAADTIVDTPLERTRTTTARPLLAVVALAFLARFVIALIQRDATIDMDGTEYIRAAQNLVAGHGFVGMRGTPIIFPPLYSLGIGGLLRLGIPPEAAAVGIAAVAGAAFAALLYLLARTLYGDRTALYAGLIGALLPACIETSTRALAEAPFAVCATAGLLFLVRWMRGGAVRDAGWCGAAFGAAYLLRPEGVLFAATSLGIVVLTSVVRKRGAAAAALLAAGAILFITPQLVRTYLVMGHATLESKSAINFKLGEGMRAGLPYLAVADAIDADGRPVGPEIDPAFYAPHAPQPQLPVRERASLALGAAIHHVNDLADAMQSRNYGAGLLVAFSVLGLFARPWARARRWDELVMFAYGITAFVALAGVWHFWPRYANIVLPVVIVWAAHGLTHFRRWSAVSRLPDVGVAMLVVLLAGSFALDLIDARTQPPPLERAAGAWIAAHGPHDLVVDVGDQTAFYAGANWAPIPYGEPQAAARYLHRIRPAYVVFDSSRAEQYPPLQPWFANGLPAGIGTHVMTISDGRGRSLNVYRYTESTARKTASARSAG